MTKKEFFKKQTISLMLIAPIVLIMSMGIIDMYLSAAILSLTALVFLVDVSNDIRKMKMNKSKS